MSKKTTAERFDCVEMKRRIQEKIYEETQGMKPDEFLAHIHKQVGESRFAAFFAGPDAITATSSRGPFQPVTAPLQVAEAEGMYSATTDNKP